jgi:hypothetical protein
VVRGCARRALCRVVLSLCALAGAVSAPLAAAAQQIAVAVVRTAPPLDPALPADAWSGATSVTLPWDVQDRRPASELSTAFITTDGTSVYVRFDVQQREALLAQQHTNDVGDGTDDEVWIDLWPNGNRGFYYQFAATSNGTHFQYSSENTAYAPTWWSYGKVYPGGFTVTMKIPFAVMRGTTSRGWRAQFVRVVRSTGERQIWSYGVAQTNGDDVSYAGSLAGMTVTAVRPQPRFAPYLLGSAGKASSGATTGARFGGDLSIPITPTASIYATLHPDFSNVEVDQQTISPTAFQRSYTEVRPFFTQGSSYYENFSCYACLQIAQLYTPAIPTPRDGYAFEGKQGQFSFAGFDALGDGRTDGASALTYRSPDSHWTLSTQDVVANLPGVTDHVSTSGIIYGDNRHVGAYFNLGNDSGTNVLDPSRAQRYDGGAYFYTNSFGFAASARKVGEYYDPVDGLVQHPDIAGYALYENKILFFDKRSWLNSIQFGSYLDRYHGTTGGLNQTDTSAWVDVLTRKLVDVNVGTGSSYLRLPSGVFTPISQNGVSVTWHSGSANDPGNNGNHGSSATPTTFSFNSGRFGPGRVDSWVRSTTMRAGMRGTLTLEVDDTRDYRDDGVANLQWLDRVGYTYAAGPNASFSVGVRKIVGTAPLIDVTAPPAFTRAANLSFAYHRRLPHEELYLAYGDASQLNTVPQWIVKIIHYFGAEKGT